ncbi:MgtC/SapB family protein [Paracoccus litorisediminis]|uniref:Protein MgtC n=1 Tax=Paracoccus litorisediminis TaxID=2006130 RepID=A0A844HU49_9RHOB|nr:MgtC/SapB family protein [Paracoccus litorisediminis]MTH61857.1 MgtC/SapB family protein [Paracoccus litorisediminis]
MFEQLAAEFARPMSLPTEVAVLRLSMALLLGGVIGWEREIKARAAGLRTHMLIALAAACFTLVAMELMNLSPQNADLQRLDPLRLIEAVTAGVAFLAAGSIVISGATVRGVTTGASMWLCGAIGLCCGTGDLRLAMIATVMAMIVLYLIRVLITPAMHPEDDE